METEIVLTASTEILNQIYNQLGQAAANEIVLEHSWMKLGALLVECKNGQHWRIVAPSFEQFMLDLRTRYNRGKTQLWSYLTVAEKLLPTIDAATLETIGISKALELKKALKAGKPLPLDIIEQAKLPQVTIKELRGQLGAALNLPPEEGGSWFDCDGFYMTASEREEFKAAIVITETILEIPNDLPDHIRRKRIFTAWMQEFIGTHMAELKQQYA